MPVKENLGNTERCKEENYKVRTRNDLTPQRQSTVNFSSYFLPVFFLSTGFGFLYAHVIPLNIQGHTLFSPLTRWRKHFLCHHVFVVNITYSAYVPVLAIYYPRVLSSHVFAPL